MSFLTGAGILDDAVSMIQDKSPALRAKLLIWLNVAAQQLATVRPWQWLDSTLTVTPVSNVITKPADYGEFKYLNLPSYKVYDDRNRLTPGEAFAADNTNMGYSYPVGFTEEENTITLHGASWAVPTTLGYAIEPPAIADSTALTVWPQKCRPYFMRYLTNSYYEYDMDERKGSAGQEYAREISELKQWDNNQKAKTQNSRHGYRRTR